MSDAIQFHSRVGADGVLNVQLNLGSGEASKDVIVTVAPLLAEDLSAMPLDKSWSEFVSATYGSCAGQGLQRPPQGDFEQREPME
jgi:hypothetical protein